MTDKTEIMKRIRDEVVGLTASPLFEYRTSNNYYAVLGEGSHDAKVMFIGEAPGKNEAETGRPFCGKAGGILDDAIVSAGMERKDVYITNIVKDRPPENRDPSEEEIEIYAPFLDRQIDAIGPEIICTLGRISMSYIMNRYDMGAQVNTISKLHGKIFLGTSPSGFAFKYIPMFHPAATIYNRSSREDFFTDMRKVADMITTTP